MHVDCQAPLMMEERAFDIWYIPHRAPFTKLIESGEGPNSGERSYIDLITK